LLDAISGEWSKRQTQHTGSQQLFHYEQMMQFAYVEIKRKKQKRRIVCGTLAGTMHGDVAVLPFSRSTPIACGG
jgi:hypothetical protein